MRERPEPWGGERAEPGDEQGLGLRSTDHSFLGCLGEEGNSLCPFSITPNFRIQPLQTLLPSM